MSFSPTSSGSQNSSSDPQQRSFRQPPLRRRRAPSALAAVGSIMRLTLRRTLRDRSVWLSVVLCLLPVIFITALGSRWSPDNAWSRVINVVIVPLFAVLPPLNLAPLIAEEAQKQTYSFLWSRPIPRWSVVLGKASAVFPLVAILLAASIVASSMIASQPDGVGNGPLGWLLLGMVLGLAATGSFSIAVGVFLPKQAVAASVAYLLAIDLPVGGMSFSIANLSMTHHIRVLAGTANAEAERVPSIVWLISISAVAMLLTLWRIRRIELAQSSS